MILFMIKLVYTDTCYCYNIPPDWTVKYTFLRMRDYIVEDFGINNTFEFIHIDIIPSSYRGKPEEYSELTQNFSENTDAISDHLYKNRQNNFYIRPIETDNFELTNGNIERI